MDDRGIRSSISLVIRQETGELPAAVLCQQDGEFEFDEFRVEEFGDYAQDEQGSVSLLRKVVCPSADLMLMPYVPSCQGDRGLGDRVHSTVARTVHAQFEIIHNT